MASRYWVKNKVGSWNSTANWSSSSAATTGGASVPSTADSVFFNLNSGSGYCTLDISPTVRTIDFTGYTGTLNFNTYQITLNYTGTILIGSTSMTVINSSLPYDFIFTSSSTAARTVTLGSVSESNAFSLQFNNPGGVHSVSGSCKNLSVTGSNQLYGSLTVYGLCQPGDTNWVSGSVLTCVGAVTVINATSMVTGQKYCIVSKGTTNFTLYGASSNSAGQIFTATGAGTGTGTVVLSKNFFPSTGSGNRQYPDIVFGNGTSQGSYYLNNYTNSNTSYTVRSGYFNTNGYPLFLGTTGSFTCNSSETKNVVIDGTISNYVSYQINLNGSTLYNTYDFSKATLEMGGQFVANAISLPSTFKIYKLKFSTATYNTNFTLAGLSTMYVDIIEMPPAVAGYTYSIGFDNNAPTIYYNVVNINNTQYLNSGRYVFVSDYNGVYLIKTSSQRDNIFGTSVRNVNASLSKANVVAYTGNILTSLPIAGPGSSTGNLDNGGNIGVSFNKIPPTDKNWLGFY
jgi:hypothetical protein